MDKLAIISGILFITSEVFAVASLVHHDWLNTGGDVGSVVLGLTKQCQTIYGRARTCFTPTLPAEWVATLIFLVAGIISLASTCCFVISSHWRRSMLIYARWAAFVATVLLCMASISFPMGFHIKEIGGRSLQFPNSIHLGSSYILFTMSIIFSVMGLVLASRICLPGIAEVDVAAM
ncbi:modulator of smoothened protein-like isoform X1 [Clavelina lepadiformis]|uniref:modulator of smoothened protein-like isoform X1 n=1 Tax=Clavelina lepadiformis TaxID=159417 RepID=UPI0040428FFA